MKKRILLGAVGALLLTACGKKEDPAAAAAPPPMPFPTQTIAVQDATVFEEYTANLEGQQNVEIRPKVDGYIQKIYVDEGQTVRKGQVLFKLETKTRSQDAVAAKSNVDAAQVEVDRLKPLVDRKIISNVQLETAKARLSQAKAAYSSIAADISYGTITSPVNGVIGSLPYKEGSLVSASSAEPLTTVSDTKVMRAYFTMNEKQMIAFSRQFKGATLQEKLKNTPKVGLLLADNSEYEEKGTLTAVNGLVDAATGTTEFRAEFANPQAVLRSGSSGIVRIPIDYKDVIMVPQGAVFDMQGKQMIYVVNKDNTVKSKIITVKTTAGMNFIVESGLEPGEVIVTEGASKLKDGMAIVPQPTQPEATAAKTDTVATSVTKTTTVTKK